MFGEELSERQLEENWESDKLYEELRLLEIERGFDDEAWLDDEHYNPFARPSMREHSKPSSCRDCVAPIDVVAVFAVRARCELLCEYWVLSYFSFFRRNEWTQHLRKNYSYGRISRTMPDCTLSSRGLLAQAS